MDVIEYLFLFLLIIATDFFWVRVMELWFDLRQTKEDFIRSRDNKNIIYPWWKKRLR